MGLPRPERGRVSTGHGLGPLRAALERTVGGVARIVDMPFNEYELAVLIVPLDSDVTPILLRAVVDERPMPSRRRKSSVAGAAILDAVDALVADDVEAYSTWDSRLGSLSFGNGIVGLMIAVTRDDVARLNHEVDVLAGR
jgi:hypothetical protein